jgi:hypothetical protein
MPPITRRARREWAISHVFALPELWAIVAEHSGRGAGVAADWGEQGRDRGRRSGCAPCRGWWCAAVMLEVVLGER